MRLYTFPKAEHMCLRREVEALFQPGSRAISVYPVRAVVRRLPYAGSGPRVKVLLSVAKRHLRHAVDRNRAKRQLREAYRLQKHLLIDSLPDGAALHVAFLWLSDVPQPTARVQKSVYKLLQHVVEHMPEASDVAVESPA